MEALEKERLKVSSPKTLQNGRLGQQEAFGEIAPKEGNYEKQGKNQSLEGLKQQGLWYPGSPRGGISGTPGP